MKRYSLTTSAQSVWLPLGAITLVAFGLFADVLVLPGDAVASHIEGDAALNHWRLRSFGYNELRHGNIVLWNPHLFSGAPYLGSFQPAHLYPLNAPYLFLPIAKALNVDMFAHVLLLGLFTYAWVRNRGPSRTGACFAAIIVMLAGTTSLRILAGHINIVAAYAWTPLLFLSVDKIFEAGSQRRFTPGWTLIAIGATAMQILAGAPQVVFMTALIAGIYCLIRLVRSGGRIVIAAQLLAVAVVPMFLGAVQLWTGVALADETTRSHGGSYEFASTFAFPPENLLTLVAPSLFGDRIHVDYWGRWAFWDTSLFMGLAAFALALYGAVAGSRKAGLLCVFFVVLTVLIALGESIPVHRLLYAWVPGLDHFRGVSKFLFFTTLFASVLAASGFDALFRDNQAKTVFAAVMFGLALVGAGAALWIRVVAAKALDANPWYGLLDRMKGTRGVFLWETVTEEYVRQTANLAILSLLVSVSILALLGVLFWVSTRRRWAAYAIVILGVSELFVFARLYRGEFRISQTERPELEALYDAHPGAYRVYDVVGWDNLVSNHVVQAGAYGVWGYHPIVLSRYSDYLSFAVGGEAYYETIRKQVFTFGADPLGEALHMGIVASTPSGLTLDPKFLQLLRCRYVVHPPETDRYDSLLNFMRVVERPSDAAPLEAWRKKERIYELPDPFPRFYLVNDYRVLEDKDSIFRTLADAQFNARQTVILEQAPDTAIVPGAELGQVELVNSSTDALTFRANLPAPAVLVITDAYSTGWRARALPGSGQLEYHVQPAFYALRAVALSAGEHHFTVEYSPPAYRYGRAASVAGWGLFLVTGLYVVSRRAFRPTAAREP